MIPFNGTKHDVEDILESIRTSIADRSPGFDGEKREVRFAALRGRSGVAEEAMEFELPAIFKSPDQPAPERTNLLGRLSEVLTSNGSGQERSRRVIPFDPPHGRMLEPPPVALEPVSAEPSAIVEKIAAENDSVKRVMPTFFDTRINRMGEISRNAPSPESEPAPKPAAAEAQQPPKLPSGTSATGRDSEAVEDAAAQLLRPILKQWLTDNMPKIVEKALKSESGAGGRGSGPRG